MGKWETTIWKIGGNNFRDRKMQKFGKWETTIQKLGRWETTIFSKAPGGPQGPQDPPKVA